MSDSSEDVQGTPAQNIFFQTLHRMITNESHTGAIDWLPDGDGFVVTLKNSFSSDILPLYFGQAKYTSFTRRLKRWGFTRVSNSGAYYHEKFRRDMVFDLDLDIDEEPAMDNLSKTLPLKKRTKWMVPSPSHSPSGQNSDVKVMPHLMRSINRQKRKEKREEDQVFPRAKKPAAHQYSIIKRSSTVEQSVEAAQSLASFGQQESPETSFDFLAPRNVAMPFPPLHDPNCPDGSLREARFSAYATSHERALMNHQSKEGTDSQSSSEKDPGV